MKKTVLYFLIVGILFAVAGCHKKQVQEKPSDRNPAILKGSDRNDLCVVPRVLPVVEAMAAIVTVNALLMSQQSHHPIL